jgi:hypothetical protein
MNRLSGLRGSVAAHPFAVDCVIAIALAAVVVEDLVSSGGYYTASQWIYAPSALLMTLPLAWRRRFPLAVCATVLGTLAVESLAVGSAPTPDVALVAWLLAIYSVAAHRERDRALAGGALSFAAGLLWMGVDDFLLPVVVFGGAWAARPAAPGARRRARGAQCRARARARDEHEDRAGRRASPHCSRAPRRRRAHARRPGLDVSAYRIVQESLTNTLRHARSKRARVVVRWEASALQLEVSDDGVGPSSEPTQAGHGLVGIRERVALFGGALVTGRSELGGYLLAATLPLSQ